MAESEAATVGGAAPAPDFGDPGFYLRDPQSSFRVLRREAPVYRWQPRDGVTMWVLTRCREIRAVSKRPDLYCNARGIRLIDMLRECDGIADAGAQTILHMDPPRHGEVRALLGKVFTPRHVAALEPWMRGLCRELLDRLPRHTPVDLVAEIAAPVPAIAIARLLGVPEQHWRQFQAAADALILLDGGTLQGAAVEDANRVVQAFFRQLWQWIRERRESPGADLLSALVHAERGGVRFDADDALTMAVTLLVAGNETTRSLISGACLALQEYPAQRQLLLARPALMPDAVEEFLRWVTPVHSHARTATRDTRLLDADIRAGDRVILMYGAANRDETVWPDADSLDLSRPRAANPHVAFGHGNHFCLGASLARLETRIVCEELLARFPRFAIAGEVIRQRSTHFNAIEQLPVVLEPDT